MPASDGMERVTSPSQGPQKVQAPDNSAAVRVVRNKLALPQWITARPGARPDQVVLLGRQDRLTPVVADLQAGVDGLVLDRAGQVELPQDRPLLPYVCVRLTGTDAVDPDVAASPEASV